jgi:hypothetical protein
MILKKHFTKFMTFIKRYKLVKVILTKISKQLNFYKKKLNQKNENF